MAETIREHIITEFVSLFDGFAFTSISSPSIYRGRMIFKMPTGSPDLITILPRPETAEPLPYNRDQNTMPIDVACLAHMAAGINPSELGELILGELITCGYGIIAGHYVYPSSVNYTVGSTSSGEISDMRIEDQNYFVIAEVNGTPGLDAVFTISNIGGKPTFIEIVGRYIGNPAHVQVVQVWNYDTESWLQLFQTESSETDITYTSSALTADHVSDGVMLIRIYHSSPGNANHRTYIDEIRVTSQGLSDRIQAFRYTGGGIDQYPDELGEKILNVGATFEIIYETEKGNPYSTGD